jgi:hypothetical protein
MLPFHLVDHSEARMITKDDIGAFLAFIQVSVDMPSKP